MGTAEAVAASNYTTNFFKERLQPAAILLVIFNTLRLVA
jgi:hypothetical protein